MRLIKLALSILFCVMICSPRMGTAKPPPQEPKTYGYRPINPVPVSLTSFGSSKEVPTNILDQLPNESMNFSIGQINGSASISYGPSAVTLANADYVVVLDYIKSATKPFPAGGTKYIAAYEGVGFRIIAHIHSKKAGITLGNFATLGVAADAGQISGDLSIQLMGLSGKEITSVLPIPTDISSSTIQSTLVAMGTIKSKIYDPSTTKIPQIVGIENLYGAAVADFNEYISLMLKSTDEESRGLTAGVYHGDGTLQAPNIATILKFWTPSKVTKYDVLGLRTNVPLNGGQLEQVPLYYVVDDEEQKIQHFGSLLTEMGVFGYYYYASTGQGTTGPKRGYTWEATIAQDHPISAQDFVKTYSTFWGRTTNIWLQEFSVNSSHVKAIPPEAGKIK